MRIAYWITMATNMHSEYVIFIVFLRQKLLRERTSILYYMYFSCIFNPHVDLFTGLLIALQVSGQPSDRIFQNANISWTFIVFNCSFEQLSGH
jgi:hypothetical protein